MNPKVPKMLCKRNKQININGKTVSHKLPNTIYCRASEIRMNQKKTNFYKVLSLGSEKVGLSEIKKAYRSMALKYHPDVCNPSKKEESTKRFLELQMAYETLSNPVLRKMYDYEMGFVQVSGFQREVVRNSMFPKEVWESQLCDLKRRSQVRMERKHYNYMCTN